MNNIDIFFFFLLFFLQSAVENCSDPGAIDNGKNEGRGPVTCISTVEYTCNEGYWLLGAEILSCGIDGRWDYVKPLCIENSKTRIQSFQYICPHNTASNKSQKSLHNF